MAYDQKTLVYNVCVLWGDSQSLKGSSVTKNCISSQKAQNVMLKIIFRQIFENIFFASTPE